MAITIKHAKTDTIADWTQADLDQQIAAGNYPPGTTLANIVLPSDWNNDHTVVGAAASGANSDITSLFGITGSITSPTYVGFNTSYATTLGVGQLGWDNTNNALAYGMANGNIIQHIGEDQYLYIKASSAITKGQVCMFTGSVGASGVLTAAPATGITDGSYIMGVAAESIANNGFGFVQTFGVITNVNTSGFADGDILWYNPSVAGGLTNTKPSAPNVKVQVAACNKGGSVGGGVITVRINTGSTLGGTDSNAQITSPTNGQILTYDGTNTYWKNTSLTAGTGISITPSATGVITVTNTSPSSGGTVTSVSGTGTVSGISLSGTVTSSGSLTLGGTLNLSSPPTIGNTTPNTGAFTSVTTPSVTASSTDLTLSAISTGLIKFNTVNGEAFRVVDIGATTTNYMRVSGGTAGNAPSFYSVGSDTNVDFACNTKGTGAFRFYTNQAQEQFRISHTASAVNYVQVTGSATTLAPVISAQGSDANIQLQVQSKGTGLVRFATGSGLQAYISDTASPVNQLVLTGGATTIAPKLSVAGTDTNISMAFQPKGTGAIDLAAGSSGVNISNGGTVTAITRTATGTAYTSPPTVNISAPTTAGGVQATATVPLQQVSPMTIVSGGTGYTVGDTLTVSGGTWTTTPTMTVATVSAGVITSITQVNYGVGTVIPSNPISVTGGTGTGATFSTTSWGIAGAFTITNAGSGYIEQPTVTFSGGGGSGASAFASIGTTPLIKALANTMQIATSMGSALDLTNYGANQTTNRYALFASATGNPAIIEPRGDTNINAVLSSRGTGAVQFYTNGFSGGGTGLLQLNVAHTASAVNYVQVTGNTTTNAPTISAQGSDTNIPLIISTKGTGAFSIWTGGNKQFQVANTATAVNHLEVTGAIATSAPILRAIGTDTNIDLALTPKGTGRVKFGTYTVSAGLVTTGYVEILDSGGTVRRLAVV